MRYIYKRPALYFIIDFVSLFLGLVIFHFAPNFLDGENYQPITIIALEIIIAIIALVFIGIECTATIEINEVSLIERKLKGYRKTELENIVGIRYNKMKLNKYAFVVIDLSDGSSLTLESWFDIHSNMVMLLCKNTILKNSNVLISDSIRDEFGI